MTGVLTRHKHRVVALAPAFNHASKYVHTMVPHKPPFIVPAQAPDEHPFIKKGKHRSSPSLPASVCLSRKSEAAGSPSAISDEKPPSAKKVWKEKLLSAHLSFGPPPRAPRSPFLSPPFFCCLLIQTRQRGRLRWTRLSGSGRRSYARMHLFRLQELGAEG